MALNYVSLADTALRLISENGATWEMRRKTTGAYNASNLGEPTYSEQIFAAYAVLESYDIGQIDDKVILTGDRKLLVAGSDLTETPLPGDVFVKGEEIFRAVMVKEIKPADLVIYWEVQVRANA